VVSRVEAVQLGKTTRAHLHYEARGISGFLDQLCQLLRVEWGGCCELELNLVGSKERQTPLKRGLTG